MSWSNFIYRFLIHWAFTENTVTFLAKLLVIRHYKNNFESFFAN